MKDADGDPPVPTQLRRPLNLAIVTHYITLSTAVPRVRIRVRRRITTFLATQEQISPSEVFTSLPPKMSR